MLDAVAALYVMSLVSIVAKSRRWSTILSHISRT